MHWHLLLTPPLPGADNMALDEALLGRARHTGEAVLRVYSWASPTLSLGRNQSVRGTYAPERLEERAVDVVRRLTGGRAVLHWREVTYSVTAPERESLRESYDRINRLLLDGLERLGVVAEVASPAGRMPPPAAAPCFELPAAGELMFAGRKLVGSAQVREEGALLQHGSILVHDDQPLVAGLALRPLPVAPAATLADALGREPGTDEVAGALFEAVRAREDLHASELVLDDALRAEWARARQRYTDDGWTWRR